VQRSIAVHPQPLPRLEIDEQEADRRVGRDVAEALEHAVAVVARESERVRRHDPHESGRAALVRAIGLALRIGRREEEEALPAMKARSSSLNSARSSFSANRSAIRRLSKRSCNARLWS
jgi:hypothetical protein